MFDEAKRLLVAAKARAAERVERAAETSTQEEQNKNSVEVQSNAISRADRAAPGLISSMGWQQTPSVSLA